MDTIPSRYQNHSLPLKLEASLVGRLALVLIMPSFEFFQPQENKQVLEASLVVKLALELMPSLEFSQPQVDKDVFYVLLCSILLLLPSLALY